MMWDIDQMKPLSATVVLSFAILQHHHLPDDAVERQKLGVNKERTTVALKGFIWSISHIIHHSVDDF